MNLTRSGYVFGLILLTFVAFPSKSSAQAVPLSIRIENNNLYINSCSSNLLAGIGYKGYVDGVEIFSTGDFGGFPCYNGDLFINNLNSFYSANTGQPFVSNFNFYANSSFDQPPTKTFQIVFDGTNFSVPGQLTGNSNILFIPGLQASRLYFKPVFNCSLNCEDQVWEPLVFEGINDLYMNSSGYSEKNLYTRDIIDETAVSKIYSSLIVKLNTLESQGVINDWNYWAYDWRYDVMNLVENGTKYENDQTVYLINTLQSLASTSQNGKVTIISHSNGGLVAKALINKLQNMKDSGQSNLVDKIDTLVLVASPQLGTPEALSALLHGYERKIRTIMNEAEARRLAKNMPSAYGLLPSKKYFEQVNVKPVAVFSSTSQQLYRDAYGTDINNYNESKDFISGLEGRSDPVETDLISPIKGNDLLFSKSVTLHDVIDNMTIPSNINVISVAGWGKETLAGIKYTGTDIEPIYTIRGDKTVVSASALYGQGTKYWLDLRNSKITHKDILEETQLLGFLENVIKKESISLSSLEPIQTENRLNLGVHSPVSIGVYDNDGNFTGKVCDPNTNQCEIIEDIPGSSYDEFGEGKYVNLGENNFQKAVLKGTDVGTFTFESKVTTPSGEENTSSFISIPVTTQTQAEIVVVNNIPQLKLDVTGDGFFDFTINPKDSFDPITYLQIIKSTVDSLDVNQSKKIAFSRRVDNIIKLIQKNKIDKAKLKVEKFKDVLENKISKPDPKKPRPKNLSKTDAQLVLDMLNKLLDNLE